MSWSEYLYYYHEKVGGQFFGDGERDGMLILTHRDRPLVVRSVGVSQGKTTGQELRAGMMLELEREYRLSIGRKSTLAQGANIALNVLDRGLDLLPRAPDVGGDYGFPEVTRNRLIQTDHRPFTKRVLQNLELRNALLAAPWASLTVKKGPVREGLHLLEVSGGVLGGLVQDWSVGDEYAMGDDWTDTEARRRRAEKEFFPRLEQLLTLTRAARDAVMAWRMT